MKELRQAKHILSLTLLLIATLIGLYAEFYPTEPPILGVEVEQSPFSSASVVGRETVKVSRVIDGDTIRLEDGRTVRYIGIDTPETQHPTQEKECFGQVASDFNQQLVEGETVELEKDVNETDRYGRLLRYVWLDDELINKTLVAQGFAVARSYPPDVARQDELRVAETEARENNRGLWAVCPLEN